MGLQKRPFDFFDTPPLKYLGGKWQIAKWIVSQMPPHRVYVEPFCGSAAVFFRKPPAEIETLNDLNLQVVNFFKVLREQPDELIRAIALTPYARDEYLLAHEHVDDPIEMARRFYVLSFQSFGGHRGSGWRRLIRIGRGSSLTAEWSRLDGLLAAAHALKGAQIENKNALDLIRECDSSDTLFYVDPPYLPETRSGNGKHRYAHEMDAVQHRELADVLHSVRGMVLISGYRSALYDELFSDWRRLEKTTTTNGNNSATECLWLSPAVTDNTRLPLFAWAGVK